LRHTVSDVAREAGVSVATVDRVLNGRSGVRGRTRELVLEAARRLGYLPEELAERAPIATVRLDFALPAGADPFWRMLREELEAQARSRPGLIVRIADVYGLTPDQLAAALLDYRGRTDAVGVAAPDHPALREAIRALVAAGTPVATMVSDVLYAPRTAFVGVDNRAAGRLAGYLLRRFVGSERPAEVAMFAGSLSYRAHEEREMGFRHLLAEEAANLRIVALREMKDDAERAYAEAATLLDAYPGLAAIYNIGGGNSGIARALKERARDRAVVFVAHEIFEDNRRLLLDGVLDAAIDQNAPAEARAALDVLEGAARGARVAAQPVRLNVVFKENIPD
jgi:LacI family transcriptional regulator